MTARFRVRPVSKKVMTCDEARKLLVALADGELAGARLDQVRGHAAACPVCGRELGDLRQDVALLRAEPAPVVPPFLRARVMASVRAPRPGPLRRLVPSLAALVLVVAAGLGIGVVIGRGIVPRALGPAERMAAVEAGLLPALPEDSR